MNTPINYIECPVKFLWPPPVTLYYMTSTAKKTNYRSNLKNQAFHNHAFGTQNSDKSIIHGQVRFKPCTEFNSHDKIND